MPSTEATENSGNRRNMYPEGGTFTELLRWHMTNGTRPKGTPERPGKPWEPKEFGGAAGSASTEGRAVRGWLKGTRPRSLVPIQIAFFGENPAYDKWVRDLQAAYYREPEAAIGRRFRQGTVSAGAMHASSPVESAIRDNLQKGDGIAGGDISADVIALQTSLARVASQNATAEDLKRLQQAVFEGALLFALAETNGASNESEAGVIIVSGNRNITVDYGPGFDQNPTSLPLDASIGATPAATSTASGWSVERYGGNKASSRRVGSPTGVRQDGPGRHGWNWKDRARERTRVRR
jgi:hypothetical protein